MKTYTLKAPIDGLDKSPISALKFKEMTGADAIQVERAVPKDAGSIEFAMYELAQCASLDIAEIKRLSMSDIEGALRVMRGVNPTPTAGE